MVSRFYKKFSGALLWLVALSFPYLVSQAQAIPANNGADSDSWFVQALNAGLDKYAAAQRLSGQDNMAASATAGAQSALTH